MMLKVELNTKEIGKVHKKKFSIIYNKKIRKSGCIINGVDGRNFYQCHFLIKKSWDNKTFLLKLNRQK